MSNKQQTLLEILVDALDEWPNEDTKEIHQDADKALFGYNKGPRFLSRQWLAHENGVRLTTVGAGSVPEVSVLASDYATAGVTKEQWISAKEAANVSHNASQELTEGTIVTNNKPMWDGVLKSGFYAPPEGVICEVIFHTDTYPKWYEVEVLFSGYRFACLAFTDRKASPIEIDLQDTASYTFRKVQSEADKQKEEIVREITDILKTNECPFSSDVAEDIYQFIAPMLEKK